MECGLTPLEKSSTLHARSGSTCVSLNLLFVTLIILFSKTYAMLEQNLASEMPLNLEALGLSRYNRRDRSSLLLNAGAYEITPVISSHFMPFKLRHTKPASSSAYRNDFFSTMEFEKSLLPWTTIAGLGTESLEHSKSQSLSQDAPLSQGEFFTAFNDRLENDSWGGWRIEQLRSATTETTQILRDVGTRGEKAFSSSSAHFSSSTSPGVLQWVHPPTSSLRFVIGDKDIVIELEKNNYLTSATYSETRISPSLNASVSESTRAKAPPNCFYRGTVSVISTDGSSSRRLSSTVAFDTCYGGFSGEFTLDRTYSIRPALNHLSAAEIALYLADKERQLLKVADFDSNELSPGALHVIAPIDFLRNSYFGVTSENDEYSFCGHNHADIPSHVEGNTEGQENPRSFVSSQKHGPSSDTLSTPFLSGRSSRLRLLDGNGSETTIDPKVESVTSVPTNLYIELLVANDAARVSLLGSHTEMDTLSIANKIGAIYADLTSSLSPTKIDVTLTRQITFSIKDPWAWDDIVSPSNTSEANPAKLLTQWLSWVSSHKASNVDNFTLFSGFDFENSVLGYAPVGSQCTSSAGSIIQTLDSIGNSSESFLVAVVAAHEIGHNFNILHDGDNSSNAQNHPTTNNILPETCPTSGFIMASSLNPLSPPSMFSECSQATLNAYLRGDTGADLSCLHNIPSNSDSGSSPGDDSNPVCGNGIREQGEECDCGSDDCTALNDSCCNGSTCKLMAGATCSSRDACCDASTCAPFSASLNRVCRAAISPCDFAEVCSGESTCPPDEFLGAGRPCVETIPQAFESTTHGTCLEKRCVSTEKSCFMRGQGVFDTPSSTCPSHIDLNNGDMCGVLYCQQKGQSTCFIGANSVENGTSCGEGRQCKNGTCLESSAFSSSYQWAFSSWTSCSVCGETQTRTMFCQNVITQEPVDSQLCVVGTC